MRRILVTLIAPCAVTLALGQAAPPAPGPPGPPPTAAQVQHDMGRACRGDVRGQRDTVGFAASAAQMARTWELSATPPAPDALGPAPAAGVAGAVAPHDDYLYAARVYRAVTPLVTAKTVVLVGVFHKYRAFGMRDRLVFDAHRAWSAPDGEIPLSPLSAELLKALPAGSAIADQTMHDAEHSLEAIAYWLRHARTDVEIVPVIVPAMSFERLQELAQALGAALHDAAARRGMLLGRDLAVVVSSDAVHYGADFRHAPFGEGGIDAYTKATARDRDLLRSLARPALDATPVRALYETFVDPAGPDTYRVPWCGRFAVPFGLLLLEDLAGRQGGVLHGWPLAYATSVGAPELPLREGGMGETAPANLYHFVGYPAAAFTIDAR